MPVIGRGQDGQFTCLAPFHNVSHVGDVVSDVPFSESVRVVGPTSFVQHSPSCLLFRVWLVHSPRRMPGSACLHVVYHVEDLCPVRFRIRSICGSNPETWLETRFSKQGLIPLTWPFKFVSDMFLRLAFQDRQGRAWG